jgi:hypothetical protein
MRNLKSRRLSRILPSRILPYTELSRILDDEIYDCVQCLVRPVFARVEQGCTGAHRQTSCVVWSCVQLVESCVQLVESCVQLVESARRRRALRMCVISHREAA